MIRVCAEADDDTGFTDLVSRLIRGTVRSWSPRRVAVIKIDNWFGANWLGFCYKILGAAGMSKRDRACPELIPPFTPERVVSQRNFHYVGEDPAYKVQLKRIHRRQSSEDNAFRKLDRITPDTGLFWWSGRSLPNGRGCLMAYLPGEEGFSGWYAGFKRNESYDRVVQRIEWIPAELKGTNRRELEAYLAVHGAKA